MSWTFKVASGDIIRKFSNNGYDTVTGVDKLKQDCRMVLTTGVRADGIGAGLNRIIGQSVDGEPQLSSTIPAMFQFQLYIRDSLNRYRYVQQTYQYSRRTFKELLDEFSPVQVWQDSADPRVFRWRIDFFSLGSLPVFALGGTTR